MYTALFASRWPAGLRIPLPRLILFAIVIGYAVGFALWLAPSLHEMTIPVMLYICVITMMVIAAIGARLPLYVPIGALLFLTSDSLLAVVKFNKASLPFRDYLVWGTYYAAQYLIATGVLRASAPPTTARRQAAA